MKYRLLNLATAFAETATLVASRVEGWASALADRAAVYAVKSNRAARLHGARAIQEEQDAALAAAQAVFNNYLRCRSSQRRKAYDSLRRMEELHAKHNLAALPRESKNAERR